MPNLFQLAIIACISSFGVFGASLIAPVEARYIQSITDNPAITGTVFGVGSLAFVLLSFWLGRLSDRFDRKNILLLGLLVGVLYAIFYASAMSVLVLYGVKFAWAVSAVAIGPVMATYLQNFLSPYEKKGKYFGYVYAAESIAGSAGALLGGYVASVSSLEMPFYVLAVAYLCMLFMVMVFLPSAKAHLAEDATPVGYREAFRHMFAKPEYWFYLCTNTKFWY